jgi:hypothetical protein
VGGTRRGLAGRCAFAARRGLAGCCAFAARRGLAGSRAGTMRAGAIRTWGQQGAVRRAGRWRRGSPRGGTAASGWERPVEFVARPVLWPGLGRSAANRRGIPEPAGDCVGIFTRSSGFFPVGRPGRRGDLTGSGSLPRTPALKATVLELVAGDVGRTGFSARSSAGGTGTPGSRAPGIPRTVALRIAGQISCHLGLAVEIGLPSGCAQLLADVTARNPGVTGDSVRERTDADIKVTQDTPASS